MTSQGVERSVLVIPQEEQDVEVNTHIRKKLTWPIWRSALVAVLLVGTVSIIATTLWDLKHNKYRFHDTFYGVVVTNSDSEQASTASRSQMLAKANLIRDQWHPWAYQHKILLAKMLQAKPNDQKTLTEVYEALPVYAGGVGVTLVGSKSFNPEATDFGWQPANKGERKLLNVPARRTETLKMEHIMHLFLQKDFTQFRDVELSKSMAPGRSSITLWASGRITEMTLNRQHILGQPAFVRTAPKEIVPPFDFLHTTGGSR